MSAIDTITGNQLWNSNEKEILVDQNYLPQLIESHNLIVYTGDLEICSLDLETGYYSWCRPETYITNIKIDKKRQIGYVLRNDFILTIVDINNGNVIGETQFIPKILPKEMRNRIIGYHIALWDDKIIVVFGDSDQVFVFKYIY